MWEASCGWPERLPDALEAARRAFPAVAPSDPPVRAVVAVGLGAGDAACHAAAALTAGRLAVPFVLCPDAVPPAFVGPDCLVVAVSCGDSPEVLEAVHRAQGRRARVVGIGNDAALARHAAGSAMPWCAVGDEGPSGRAAMGPATVAVLSALHAAGLLADPSAEVRAAADVVAGRRDAFAAERGTAAELARRIGRTIPLVYGSGVAAVAARWWKSCVNLNAKSPAFAAELPGLAYDEVAGWGQGGDITRQTMTLVFLRNHAEPSAIPRHFEFVRTATEEVMADVLELWPEDRTDLGMFFELALLGELVSLELAAREGVDPGPVPAVEDARVART